MATSRKVPRASIAVSVLRDSDFIALFGTRAGRAAWGCYVALIASAKDKRNHGIFPEPLQVVAKTIHCRACDLAEAIELISVACLKNGNEPWLVQNGRGLVIRRFSDWNEHDNWGGNRSILEPKLDPKLEPSRGHLGAPPIPIPIPTAQSSSRGEQDAAAAGRNQEGNQEALEALDKAGVGEPKRTELARTPGVSASVVIAAWRACMERGKGPGAVVFEIERRLRVARAPRKSKRESALQRQRREDATIKAEPSP